MNEHWCNMYTFLTYHTSIIMQHLNQCLGFFFCFLAIRRSLISVSQWLEAHAVKSKRLANSPNDHCHVTYIVIYTEFLSTNWETIDLNVLRFHHSEP